MPGTTAVTGAIQESLRAVSDTPTSEIAAPEMAAAYEIETACVIRHRLNVTMFLLLLFVGVASAGEWLVYPQHSLAVALMYGATVVTAALGLAAAHTRRLERWTTIIAVGVMMLIDVLLVGYGVIVESPVERAAMAHLCLATGLVVMLPWGWRAQLAVAVTSLLSFGVSAPYLVAHETIVNSMVAVFTGAVTSVCGALFLERHRRDAFLRAALLKREAEIAAALVKVGETLNAHLHEPDLLERVNVLAVRMVDCDWSAVFRWLPESRAIRLHASAGVRPEVVVEVSQIDLAADEFPIVTAAQPGTFVEIQDGATTSLAPPDLLRRWDVASALYVPIMRRNQMLGVLVEGYRDRTGPFSMKQRRIALGIAHATASAMQTAALIHDLQAASRLKSEFVSTMSHELRTPLNVISGYADLLIQGTFDALTAPQQDTVERIHRSALDLLEMVSATLDVSRLETGREHVERTPVDVAALCSEIAREVEPLVSPGVRLHWDVDGCQPRIVSDRVKLKTILKNLVGNALKFTTAGAVGVVATTGEGTLWIAVRDTGVGIAAADLPVIFDMFRQGDGSDTRRFGGVGLGLHIVQRLTAILGGTVTVESTIGAGSTFLVALPFGVQDVDAPERTIAA